MKKNIKLHLAHYLKRYCCFPRLSKNGPFTKFVGSFDFCSCPLFVWYFKGRGLFFCGCVRSFLFVGWNNIFSSKKKRKEHIALFRVVNHISHNITQGRLHLVCFFQKMSSRTMWLKRCWLLTVVFSSNKKVFSKVERSETM